MISELGPEVVFQVYSPALDDETVSVLGLWATEHGLPEAVDFSAPAGSAIAGGAVWRANLPTDADSARAHLERAKAQIDATMKALALAEERLDLLVKAQTAEISFGLSPTQESLSSPEQSLLALLGEIRDDEAVTFGLRDSLSGPWKKAIKQFQSFVTHLQEGLAYHTRVETRVEGILLAFTLVSWKGGADTLWSGRISRDQAELHKRTLELAIESKDALLKMFIVVAKNAAKLSLLISTGSAILALPAAWKYVQEVLSEAEKVRAISDKRA